MTVYLVIRQAGYGYVAGVFSNQNKASKYIQDHPYDRFILSEHVVDEIYTGKKEVNE